MAKAISAQEFRAKSEDQLKAEMLQLKKEIFNLRFQQSSGELRNTSRKGKAQREIARIQTVLKEKASGIQVAAKPAAEKKSAAKKAAKPAPKKTSKKKES